MQTLERQQVLDAIPSNWLDPLLTGEGKVVNKSPCPEVQALLNAVRARIAALPIIETK